MKDLTEKKKVKDALKSTIDEAKLEGYKQGFKVGQDKMIQAIMSWMKRQENENHRFKEFIWMWYDKSRIDHNQITCRGCPDCSVDTLCTAASRVGTTLPDCPICDFHIKRLADGYDIKSDRTYKDDFCRKEIK